MRALMHSLLHSAAMAAVVLLAPGLAAAAEVPDLYVANGGINTIELYNPPSGVGTTFDSTGLNLPYDLALDALGNLYVANGLANTIEEITPSGVTSTFASGLDFPTSVAFDSEGNLYVANYSNYTIDKITPSGAVSLFATLPPDSGPGGLAFDDSGNLYVSLSNGDMIDKISPAGTVSTFASGSGSKLASPYALAFNPAGTLLFVANYGNNTIVDFTLSGTEANLAISGLSDGDVLNAPAGLAFDPSGDLFVSNDVGNTIDEITAIAANGKTGTGKLFANTGLAEPWGLAYYPVPEPASIGLFAMAVVALGALRLRRPARAIPG